MTAVTAAVEPQGTTNGNGDPTARCTATSKSTGERCRQLPMNGTTVCRFHGGKAKQVRVKAQRRLAEKKAAATLAEVGVTPIGNPLAELAEVTAEARAWQQQVAAMVSDLGTNWAAWPGHGEQLRAIVPLFERALDRCGKLLGDWVRLGFDERMVTLHEHQAELVAQVIRSVLADPELGLTEAQRQAAPAVTRRHLTAVAS